MFACHKGGWVTAGGTHYRLWRALAHLVSFTFTSYSTQITLEICLSHPQIIKKNGSLQYV